eukprot:scaffold7012_cov157-Amphora_coffeaeformis.AAC.5
MCRHRYNLSRRFVCTFVAALWTVPVPTSFAFLVSSSLLVIRPSSSSSKTIVNSMDDPQRETDYYRSDGVRITHDPYAPGMASKYGLPGETDPAGFDPYADTVGPGIYGGAVERDEAGNVRIGQQYQLHNHRPGPIYSGQGYSLMSRALQMGPEKDVVCYCGVVNPSSSFLERESELENKSRLIHG